MELKDKVVAITGAGRGLGAAMARALAAKGARLALIDRERATLAGVRAQCSAEGAQAREYLADIAREPDVVSLFERIAGEFGALHGLINNAGILRDALLIKAKGNEVTARLSLADWQHVLDVNLTGVFLCGREAAAQMVQLGTPGLILNVSSISRAGNVGQSNYSAAKAGVAALTVTWARELARHGIRVAALAPGFVNTEMVASMRPELRERMVAGIPLARMAEPEEVAHSAVYLFENDFFNGRCLELDGGQRL